jgi:NAD(P)-dependent dehydrogenase (short-subunit alcohol dehydrogenase family)
MDTYLGSLFSLAGRVALVTGATGALGGTMARGLARAGARVAVMGRRADRAKEVAAAIAAEGGEAMPLPGDVLQRAELEAARGSLLARWGRLDILVNAAGGNMPAANVPPEGSVFDLTEDALRAAVDLNLFGTILPCQVFGAAMAEGPAVTEEDSREPGTSRSIVNISSLAADRALTRVAGYTAAKAAVEQFTRWLAVDLGRTYGDRLRVNAIAPGFFLGEQNRNLLLNSDGSLTARGQSIVAHTPAGRFGQADELIGALIWLCSPSAAFVTGTVVVVDGGFSAFSGV